MPPAFGSRQAENVVCAEEQLQRDIPITTPIQHGDDYCSGNTKIGKLGHLTGQYPNALKKTINHS
jgi:hypothetical protein